MNRREFLAATAAIVATPVLPALPAAAASAAGADASGLMAFTVGTPGEFDWQWIVARSPQEAFREWLAERCLDDEDAPEFDPEYVTRVPDWDGRTNVTAGDWLRAGLGHCCSRCGYETDADQGARAVGPDAVCEDCLTLADIAATDPAQAAEDLADRIADEGAETVEASLRAKGQWQAVEGDIWAKALATLKEAGLVEQLSGAGTKGTQYRVIG